VKKRLVLRLGSLILLIVGPISVIYIWSHAGVNESRPSKVYTDGTRLPQELRDGQLDEAIAKEEAALQKNPKNPDILRSLGSICLLKASQVSPAESEQWITRAANYGNELARSISRTNVLDIANLFEAGKILEGAGDLSDRSCLYYKQAKSVLEKDGPVVNKGTTITLYGHTQSLDQAIMERNKLMSEIEGKLVTSHCTK
jgi:hypothetical protein